MSLPPPILNMSFVYLNKGRRSRFAFLRWLDKLREWDWWGDAVKDSWRLFIKNTGLRKPVRGSMGADA